MKPRFYRILARVALAVPAALITVEVLSMVGLDRDHWSWPGIIAAVAGLAASFAPDVSVRTKGVNAQ